MPPHTRLAFPQRISILPIGTLFHHRCKELPRPPIEAVIASIQSTAHSIGWFPKTNVHGHSIKERLKHRLQQRASGNELTHTSESRPRRRVR